MNLYNPDTLSLYLIVADERFYHSMYKGLNSPTLDLDLICDSCERAVEVALEKERRGATSGGSESVLNNEGVGLRVKKLLNTLDEDGYYR